MGKKNLALALSVAALALPSAPAMAATTFDLSTGTNVSGGRDQTWLVQGPGTSPSSASAPINAYVTGDIRPVWFGDPNNAINEFGSRWVTPQTSGNTSVTAGTYSYTTKFTLGSLAGITGMILSGRFWSDNNVRQIVFNDNVLVYNNPAASGSGNEFSSTQGIALNALIDASFLRTGANENVLKVDILNAGGPSGFNSTFVASAVPEPGTWMLMLLGFGAIGFSMRFRQKNPARVQFA